MLFWRVKDPTRNTLKKAFPPVQRSACCIAALSGFGYDMAS